MNNNDNKKSAIDRIFKQAGVSAPKHPDKTYFAHRYHDTSGASVRNPFHALFSDVGKEPSTRQCASAGSKDYQTTDESIRTPGSERPQALVSCAALSDQFIVLNCYDETPDTKTFRICGSDGQIFDYLPGQYLTLSMAMYKRSYSLASSPTRSKYLEITVKRDPNGGVVSNWLNDHLNIGDKVYLKGPFGKFSCATQNCEKILFLAAGSGIVPIMSMLRWLSDTNTRADVRVLLSFRTPEDIIYRDELKLIAARHRNIRIAITLTADTVNRYQWPGLTGRVNEKMIAELTPDLPERMVYLCGPDTFMAECEKKLLRLKLPVEHLLRESFTVSCPPAKAGESEIIRAAAGKTGNYRISFARSGKTIAADGRMTLLELAEQAGIAIAHECRTGNCGECMIKCLKGKTEMTDQAEIDERDRKKGWVFACCAYPASDVVLDL